MSQLNPESSKLNDLIASYLEAEQLGEAPDRAKLINDHPDCASQLQSFFDNHDAIVSGDPVGDAARPPAGQPGAGEDPTLPPSPAVAATVAQHQSGPSSEVGVESIKDYKLLEEIARGGMGVVYRAHQISLNRIVAVKMILAGQLASSDDVKRFYAEAEAAANLQHPNIVAIYEVGQQRGQHFFSMEFIEGKSLSDVVRDEPLSTTIAARYLKLIAEAIEYAHQRGILHRDLKPANVLIDQAGQPRITDFGLAKRIEDDSGLTGTGQILGTPSYMPPEQAAGKPGEVGPASDVYALGAVLYEMLTGRPPFRSETQLDTLMQVLEEEPVSPRLLNNAVTKDLETICLKCLSKEQHYRYSSAAALADDLERFLTERPIQARPVSAGVRVGKWVRRQRRSVALSAIAVAATVTLVLGVLAAGHLRDQFLLGYFTLNTEGPALTAEVLDEQGKATLLSFPVPTERAQALPTGFYRLRLSAPGITSEVSQLLVQRGVQQDYRVQVTERQLWKPLRMETGESARVIEFDDRDDVVLLEKNYGEIILRRLSGSTAEQIWKLPLNGDQIPDLVIRQEARRDWNTRVLSDLKVNFVDPAPDLDADGTRDLVWWFHRCVLAISGKTGQIIWWLRSLPSDSQLLGAPVAADVGGDLALVLVYATREGNWVANISGNSGTQQWRLRLPASVKTVGNPQTPLAFVVSDLGKHVVVVSRGQLLFGLDLATGRSAWASEQLSEVSGHLETGEASTESVPLRGLAVGGETLQRPQLADLDGDGFSDLLIHYSKPAVAKGAVPVERLKAVSLKDQATLWDLPPGIEYRPRSWATPPNWPLAADLDGDGASEVVLPGTAAPGRKNWVGIRVLNGKDGRLRWFRPLMRVERASHTKPQIKQLVLGSDLNGDGHLEFAVASTGQVAAERFSSRTPGGRSTKTGILLFVDVLSGKDGRQLRWWKKRGLEHIEVGPMKWWQPAPDGWPDLLVPSKTIRPRGMFSWEGGLDVVTLGTGQSDFVPASSSGEAIAAKVADFNGDRIPDVYYEQRTGQTTDLIAIEGAPPQAWRRIGSWIAAEDYDRDGYDDLVDPGTLNREFTHVISGKTGELLFKWPIRWDHNTDTAGHSKYTPPMPLGDLDKDGTADLIAVKTFGWPMQAISGRTGHRLWLFRDSIVPPALQGGRRSPYGFSPVCADLDGDGHTEILCPFHVSRRPRQGSHGISIGFAVISGRDGALVWTTRISDEIVVENYTSRVLPIRISPEITDLDGDGIRDVVLTVPVRKQEDGTVCELQARSGGDGRLLWPAKPVSMKLRDHAPDELPPPPVGDVDGDGRPEVIVLDYTQKPGGDSHTQFRLKVLDGENGTVKWEWGWHDIRDFWTSGPILVDLEGDGRSSVCLGLNESGDEELVVLGPPESSTAQTGSERLVVVRRMPAAINLIGHDLDADGRDEILFVRDGKVTALRDGKAVAWEWPLADRSATIREILSAKKATVVIQTGRNALFGIDGATGKPIWHGSGMPPGRRYSTEVALLKSDDRDGLPRVVSSRHGTVCHLTLPSDAAGRRRLVAAVTKTPTLSVDPRVIRPLPWAPGENEIAEAFAFLPLQAASSTLLLVLPGWAVWWMLRRRRWSLLFLMLMPVLFALVAVAHQYLLTLTLFRSFAEPQWFMFVFAVSGLPLLAFPGLIIGWAVRFRWRRVALLVGLSVLLSIVFAAIGLMHDLADLDSFQQGYSFAGWYLIWCMGAYAAGSIALGLLVVLPVARALRAKVSEFRGRNPPSGVTVQ